MIELIRYIIGVPRMLRRVQELRNYIEQYQPVGMAGNVQRIMGWNYRPK